MNISREPFILIKSDGYCIPISPDDGMYMTHGEVQEYIDCLNNYINKTNNEAIKKANILREKEIKRSEKETFKKLEVQKLKSKTGYIYFVKTINGSYKIGQTINLKSRIKSFQAIDENIKLEHYIKVKNPLNVEKLFHNYYKEKHIKNELFKLTESDIKSIKELKLPKEILVNII